MSTYYVGQTLDVYYTPGTGPTEVYYSVNNGSDYTLIETLPMAAEPGETTYSLLLTADHIASQFKMKFVDTDPEEDLVETEAHEVRTNVTIDIRSWQHEASTVRQKVTTDPTKPSSFAKGIPIYINPNRLGAAWHTAVKANGLDSHCYLGPTEINREIIYDAATDAGEIHAALPVTSNLAGIDCDIYAGSGVDSANVDVWTGYHAVYHLMDVSDSKGSYNLTNNGTVTFVDGKIYKSGRFGGANYLSNANALNFERTQAWTISFWLKFSNASGTQMLVDRCEYGGNTRGIAIYQSSSVLYVLISNTFGSNYVLVSCPGFVDTTYWHKVDVTYDGSSTAAGVKIYQDGELVTNVTVGANNLNATTLTAAPFCIGSQGTHFYATADIDEVRIATSVFDADRIAIEYANQSAESDYTDIAATVETKDNFDVAPVGTLVKTLTQSVINDIGWLYNIAPTGINEFDLVYAYGLYHLFYCDLSQTYYKCASTVAGLEAATPALLWGGYTIPSAIYENDTWYVTTPYLGDMYLQINVGNPAILASWVPGPKIIDAYGDISIRKSPIDNKYYSAGLKEADQRIVHLFRADTIDGTWTELCADVFDGEYDGDYVLPGNADPMVFFYENKMYLTFAGGNDGNSKCYLAEIDPTTGLAKADAVKIVNNTDVWLINGDGYARPFNPVFIDDGINKPRIYYSAQRWTSAGGWGYIEMTDHPSSSRGGAGLGNNCSLALSL